jgi:uncharacterized lipoprotein YmbA
MSGGRRCAARLVLGLLLVSGCSILSPRPDPSRFFTLTPIAEPGPNPGALAGHVLGIGPITFPPYLDRPELVTRVGPNEVRSAAFDYWAGSLAKQFETTLSHDLQALLGPSSVQSYPWYAGGQPDLVVEVDVAEFERAIDGQAHLQAGWRLRKPSGEVLRAAETKLARPAAGDPGSTVAALSELVGEFSRELADAVRALPASAPAKKGTFRFSPPT